MKRSKEPLYALNIPKAVDWMRKEVAKYPQSAEAKKLLSELEADLRKQQTA